MTGPLDGVKVVEVAMFAMVPSAVAILADWGADVIKVEHPKVPDPVRYTAGWGVPGTVNGISHLWEAANRGKRAIAVDIGQPEGYAILMEILANADIFATSLLPASRQKLHIEPNDLFGRNPRLIYARGSARGPLGEEADRGGFDGIVFWGRSGAAIGVSPPAEAPLATPGPGYGDLQSAVPLAAGISAALYQRERTGTGTIVDASLLSAGTWGMGMTISGTSVLGVAALPFQKHASSPNPLAATYRTRDDKYVTLAFIQSDQYWPEFCVLIDRLDLLADVRMADSAARERNNDYCIGVLDDLFAERTFTEWTEILCQQEGQWDVILAPGEVQYDEQARANGYVQLVDHETGTVALVAAPAQFGGVPPVLGRAPGFGEHTTQVLLDQGLNPATISNLYERGIVA